jgi:predicted anti-sigma-YlaC factor YlaD
MNCSEWEQRIALAAGGDLERAEAVEVETHLAGCADCRSFAEEIAAVRDDLSSFRAVEDAAVGEARVIVMETLRHRRAVTLSLVKIAAAAIACLVFGWTLLPSREVAVPARPKTIAAETPRHVEVQRPVVRQAAVRKHRPPRPPQVARAVQPTIVKIFTDDPDVVIVWIAD